MLNNITFHIVLTAIGLLFISCGPSQKEIKSITEDDIVQGQIPEQVLVKSNDKSANAKQVTDNEVIKTVETDKANQKEVLKVSKSNSTNETVIKKSVSFSKELGSSEIIAKPSTEKQAIEREEKPVEVPAGKTTTVNKVKETVLSNPIEESVPPNPSPIQSANLDHDQWNILLQKHVSKDGRVNYKGFQADRIKLENYCNAISRTPVDAKWSKARKMAYWINAYNAFTVKLIVDNYPVKSIINLEEGKPWDSKWIIIGNQTYSLNQIEHDIIRPRFKDARIHFAVNCAAKSCPPLLNKAWTADNLESNLAKQTKGFINNAKYNTFKNGSAKVSKIFDWYREDFGDLKAYINKYSASTITANIEFSAYDWNLNE